MLELFTRRAVFQGDDEIHQLQVIYRVMGTPNTTDWPELVEQPWYELVKPKDTIASQFRESFSRWLSPAALDLAQALLAYNPKRRMTAAQALEASYFLSEEPGPEMPTGFVLAFLLMSRYLTDACVQIVNNRRVARTGLEEGASRTGQTKTQGHGGERGRRHRQRMNHL